MKFTRQKPRIYEYINTPFSRGFKIAAPHSNLSDVMRKKIMLFWKSGQAVSPAYHILHLNFHHTTSSHFSRAHKKQ